MALTSKQMLFAQNVVNGMSYTDAYIDAYNCNSKNAAYVEGSKMALRDDIQDYIKTLQKPIIDTIQAENISARQKQIDFINDRISHCIANNDEQSIIRYTDMLNKIFGTYKEDNEQKTQNNVSIETLDTDDLRKLIG